MRVHHKKKKKRTAVLQAEKVAELRKKYQLIWKEHVSSMQEAQWTTRISTIQYLKGQEANSSVSESSENQRRFVVL